jgi:hypothetical protein
MDGFRETNTFALVGLGEVRMTDTEAFFSERLF